MQTDESNPMKFVSSRVSILCGILAAIIGAMALFGWYAHLTVLVTGAGFIAMVYNTALSFAVLGAALALMNFSRGREAAILGVVVLVFAGLHFYEDVSDTNLGIDQFFLIDYVNTTRPHPGRMAIDTSVCFMLIGAALLTINQKRFPDGRFTIAAVLGSIVFAHVSVVAFLNYGAGMEPLYKIDARIRMAQPTAVGFLILSAGVLTFSWRNSVKSLGEVAPWTHYVVGASLFILALDLSLIVNQGYKKGINERLKVTAESVQDAIFDRIDFYSEVTHYLSRRLDAYGPTPESSLVSEAIFHARHCVGMQTIVWLDPSFAPIWAAPHESDKTVLTRNIVNLFQDRWPAAFEQAIKSDKEAFILSEDGKMAGVLKPAYRGEDLIGFTLTIINFKSMIDNLLRKNPYKGKMEFFAGGRLAYARGNNSNDKEKMVEKVATFNHNMPWHLNAWPDASELSGEYRNIIPWLVFLFGVLLSFVAMLLLKQTLALRKYQKHLEDIVAQRTAAFENTHKQLLHSEKLNALGKLTGCLAHEFNNPLYGVRNIIEQTLEAAGTDAPHKKLLELGLKECDRMARLIRQLQDFYRPSESVIAAIDINRLLQEMVQLTRKKMQERHIAVKMHLTPGLPKINGVEDQLRQVVLNFLQNAGESIDDKGGEITLTTATSDSTVKISIKDTGSGIKPEHMKTIFEPFFTTKTAVKGTGLGLSVSYGIIKDHEGEITVESRVGQGSVFTISLPAMS